MQIFVSIRFSLLGNNLWCRVHIIFSFIHTHTQWHKFLPFVLRYYQEHVSALNCILYTDILCPNFLSTPFCPVSQSLWTPWSPSYIVWFTRMKKMQIICSETPPVTLQISIHHQEKESLRRFCIANYINALDDNFKILCKGSRVLLNGEKM